MSRHLTLLRAAADYALAALDTVTPDVLWRPTPCAKWDLHMLLRHISSSVAAFQEGLDERRVGLFPRDVDDLERDPADFVRVRMMRLLEGWTTPDENCGIAVADQRIPLAVMADAATLEIAIHGWDVYQASGHQRPIPAELAAELLVISSQLVPEAGRHHLFAPPVAPSPSAGPNERVLAFLGRPSAQLIRDAS